MKRLPVFTAALAFGFLLYALYKKKLGRYAEDPNEIADVNTENDSRHITNVFAKAKNVATSEEVPAVESASL
jgi:hypothetical protein